MRKQFLGIVLFTLFASPAAAHHPLGGLPMETFTHGLLSGIGHPLLGFDHLLFVIGVGIAAAYTKAPGRAVFAYIAAMLAGCVLMAYGVGLPIKETVIAVSLLVVGGVILSGRMIPLGGVQTLFVLFGLFHGSAFGDALAGHETTAGQPVLLGYLLGLGVLQFALARCAGYAVRVFLRAELPASIEARLSGAVIAGAGLLLTLEATEGNLFALMGFSS